MKKLVCFSIAVFFCLTFSYAQVHKKVKITYTNGSIVEGTQGFFGKDSVVFNIGDAQKSSPMSDVLTIQAKKGSSGTWACGCGLGCAGTILISTISSGGADYIEDSGSTVGAYVAASALIVACSAAVGALIGSAFDKYKTVYSKNFSYLNNFDFNFSQTQITRFVPVTNNLTLSYRF